MLPNSTSILAEDSSSSSTSSVTKKLKSSPHSGTKSRTIIKLIPITDPEQIAATDTAPIPMNLDSTKGLDSQHCFNKYKKQGMEVYFYEPKTNYKFIPYLCKPQNPITVSFEEFKKLQKDEIIETMKGYFVPDLKRKTLSRLSEEQSDLVFTVLFFKDENKVINKVLVSGYGHHLYIAGFAPFTGPAGFVKPQKDTEFKINTQAGAYYNKGENYISAKHNINYKDSLFKTLKEFRISEERIEQYVEKGTKDKQSADGDKIVSNEHSSLVLKI